MTTTEAKATLAYDFADFHNAAGRTVSASFRMVMTAIQVIALTVVAGCEWLKEQTRDEREPAIFADEVTDTAR